MDAALRAPPIPTALNIRGIRMKGVVSYFERIDSEVKLVLDDVYSTSGDDLESWGKNVIFTSRTYPTQLISELNLSKDLYAEIGENLVLRLLALNGMIK